MSNVLLLSLTASVNPTLVAATTVMLLLPSPKHLMLGYLFGAYLASMTLGFVIVSSLSNSSAANTTQNTLSPAVDIGLGAITLVAAFVLHTGRYERWAERRRARKAANAATDPPRWQRALSKGSPRMTFVIGVLLTLPGASYLAGLDEIHKLHYSTAATGLLVIGFNLVMLWVLEVPLVSFMLAPGWTPGAVERGWGSEREAIGPLEVVELGLLDGRERRHVVFVPGVLVADNLLRGEFGDASEPYLRARILGTLGQRLCELVDVPGGGVVDDRDVAHQSVLLRLRNPSRTFPPVERSA